MGRYIKINNGELIQVEEVTLDPDLSNKKKLILTIIVNPTTKPYHELFELFTAKNVFDINEYRDESIEQPDGTTITTTNLKAEYVGFGKDLQMAYNNNKKYPKYYCIKAVKYSAEELQLMKNKELTEANTNALVGLYEL